MSESSIPFSGGTALADPPAPAPVLPDPSDEGNRTKLLALAGGAVVLVIAVAAYFLFFAGGGSEEPAAAPVPKGVVPPAAAPAPAADATTTQHINAKNFGRDPFKALIVEAPAATAPDASTTTSTETTTESSTSTAPTSGTTDTATTTPVVTSAHTFRVVGVSTNGKMITVRVDGKSYSGLKAGDVFATYFKVVLVGGKVNGFQFGDEKFSVFGTKKLHIAA